MDIQSNILDKLLCSKCNKYLSYAPIMITEDGENFCGRCVNEISDKKLIRNKAYEDFAAVAAFPCRYKESGCEIIIPWQDVKVHEDHCEYRSTECPVAPLGTCEWKGPQCALLDHYKEIHPELILEHPCSLDADIVVDNDKNMLLSFLGFVFLVQIRCNTALSKLWHCVHCFAQPQFAQQFNFCVEFSSNEDECSYKKRKIVLAEKCLTMQIENSIETRINGLLELLGDGTNIKVVLTIFPKNNSDLQNLFLCAKCKNLGLPAVFRNNDEYYCSDCKLETSFLDRNMEYLYGKVLKTCKNSNLGCPYLHSNKKLLCRHEMWECKWQKKCVFNCDLNFDQLRNHMDTHFYNSLPDYPSIGSVHYGQIKIDSKNFICKFLMKLAYVKIYIYSQMPVEDIHLYKFRIRFDSGENLIFKYTPTAEHDWEIHQTFLENNPYVYINSNKLLCRRVKGIFTDISTVSNISMCSEYTGYREIMLMEPL